MQKAGRNMYTGSTDIIIYLLHKNYNSESLELPENTVRNYDAAHWNFQVILLHGLLPKKRGSISKE